MLYRKSPGHFFRFGWRLTGTQETLGTNDGCKKLRLAYFFFPGPFADSSATFVAFVVSCCFKVLQLYQKDAGTRLEAAFRTGRSSVPLAGLQPELEGAIASRHQNKTTKTTIW